MSDSAEDRIWHFRCTADRLPTGRYRVRVQAAGRCIERTGYHPLWELIRILGGRGSNSKETV